MTRIGTIVFLAAIAAGCEPTNLYVAHTTVVGVNAAMNADQGSGHLIIGYDRHFGAIIPKSVATTEGKEAMSVLSCSDSRSTASSWPPSQSISRPARPLRALPKGRAPEHRC